MAIQGDFRVLALAQLLMDIRDLLKQRAPEQAAAANRPPE